MTISIDEELELIGTDINNVRIEIINLRSQVTMLQNMVNGLQKERAEREKSISREVQLILCHDNEIRTMMKYQVEELAAAQRNKILKELSDKADSI
jgi:hypothetical protein